MLFRGTFQLYFVSSKLSLLGMEIQNATLFVPCLNIHTNIPTNAYNYYIPYVGSPVKYQCGMNIKIRRYKYSQTIKLSMTYTAQKNPTPNISNAISGSTSIFVFTNIVETNYKYYSRHLTITSLGSYFHHAFLIYCDFKISSLLHKGQSKAEYRSLIGVIETCLSSYRSHSEAVCRQGKLQSILC